MIGLRGTYYTDELVEFLRNIVGEETVHEYYSNSIHCKVTNIPAIPEFDDATPALKVAWNLLNRGFPTRASIKLSNYLLKNCFDQDYQEPDYSKPAIKGFIQSNYDYDPQIVKEISGELV
jgi:hypothetical protein